MAQPKRVLQRSSLLQRLGTENFVPNIASALERAGELKAKADAS